MSKIEELKQQIQTLSLEDFAELRDWFSRQDFAAWDKQIEADIQAGRLDALGEAARRARREGRSKDVV